MLIGTSFGTLYVYDVCEHPDGYVVLIRDDDEGDLNEETTLFRSLPAAIRYAEWAAAYDRARAAEELGDRAMFELAGRALSREWSRYVDVSDRLGDGGKALRLVDLQEVSEEPDRRTLH